MNESEKFTLAAVTGSALLLGFVGLFFSVGLFIGWLGGAWGVGVDGLSAFGLAVLAYGVTWTVLKVRGIRRDH